MLTIPGGVSSGARRIITFLGLALTCAAVPAAAQTKLWIQSDSGDYIGQGLTQAYTSPTDAFSTTTFSQNHVSVQVAGWNLDLVARPNAILGAGPYEAAARYPFQGTSNGLSFSGNGRGCNILTGRFVVLSVTYNASGNISSLAADFEQHCEGGAAALWGELRINSSVPLTIDKPAGWTRPDGFDFGGQLGVQPSILLTSLQSTIYGINTPASIVVIDAEYSVNGGPFTTAAGTVNNRDHVRMRRLSPATASTSVTASVIVGGDQTGTFTLATATPGQPQTAILVNSLPGDYVGQGQTLFAQTPDWSFSLGSSGGVSFSGNGPGGRYLSLTLRGPSGATLTTGAYEDAARAPFANSSPGLELDMDSRGCNEIYGRFAVLEIDLASTPPRLAADFEQWCDGDAQPLFGEIRVNSGIPFTFQEASTDVQPDPMGFNADNPVRAGSVIYSNQSRIYGVNAPVPISISGGGEYSVNDGPFTSSPGTANAFDLVQVRLKASTTRGAARQATLNAGGQLSTFSVQTYGPGTPVTGVFFHSSPGDYIGAGQTLFFPGSRNSVTVSRYGAGVQVSLSGVGGHWFYALVQGPGGAALAPGVYENSARMPTVTSPGLDFFGDGRGCNQSAGRFVVQEIVYNTDSSVQKLAIDFEQHCEITGPPLFGQLRFNSSIPFSFYLAPNKPLDLSGDGFDDLVWQHTDGRVATWLMNGLSSTATAEILGAGSGWHVAQIADLDGDGKSDLVWQHSDGRVALYLMNGTTPSSTLQVLGAGTGWSVTHTPDLNGDGKADLLFQNTDGSVAVWTMNGTSLIAGATIMGPGTGWSVVKTADFDGDGNDDLLWKHADGRVAIWLMNGITIKATGQILNAGTGWSVAAAADLSGDGKADIVWQHTDGSIAAWLMNGTTITSGATLLGAGTGWQVARTADFDGDGRADLFFQHPDGRAAIWLMNGLTATAENQILNAGSGWTLRRTADVDGDGRADIVWQHSDGRVAIWLMYGSVTTSGSTIIGPGTGWSVSTAGQ